MQDRDTGPVDQDQANEQAEGTDMDLELELESLRAELEERDNELAQVREAMARNQADVENQRRRMMRELEQSRRFANESLLRELLQVCDNLERGLAVDHPDVNGLKEGMVLTRKALLKVMEENGLEQIDPMGQAFDPEFHEAMSAVPPEPGQEPDMVVNVFEKGYVLNQRLLRPARVVVTRGA